MKWSLALLFTGFFSLSAQALETSFECNVQMHDLNVITKGELLDIEKQLADTLQALPDEQFLEGVQERLDLMNARDGYLPGLSPQGNVTTVEEMIEDARLPSDQRKSYLRAVYKTLLNASSYSREALTKLNRKVEKFTEMYLVSTENIIFLEELIRRYRLELKP